MGLGASQIGQGKTGIDGPGPKKTTGLRSAEAGACLQVVHFFRRDEALQPSFLPIAVKRRAYTALGLALTVLALWRSDAPKESHGAYRSGQNCGRKLAPQINSASR